MNKKLMYTVVCALGLQAAMPAHAGMWSNFTNWFNAIPAESKRTAGIVAAGLVAAVGACFGVYSLWAKKQKAVEVRVKAERQRKEAEQAAQSGEGQAFYAQWMDKPANADEKARAEQERKTREEQQASAEQQAFYVQYQDVDRNSPSAANGTMTAQAIQTVANGAQSVAQTAASAVSSAAQTIADKAPGMMATAGTMTMNGLAIAGQTAAAGANGVYNVVTSPTVVGTATSIRSTLANGASTGLSALLGLAGAKGTIPNGEVIKLQEQVKDAIEFHEINFQAVEKALDEKSLRLGSAKNLLRGFKVNLSTHPNVDIMLPQFLRIVELQNGLYRLKEHLGSRLQEHENESDKAHFSTVTQLQNNLSHLEGGYRQFTEQCGIDFQAHWNYCQAVLEKKKRETKSVSPVSQLQAQQQQAERRAESKRAS
ncbi:MAG: hypothetical protein ACHQVS_04010 [Candidatus Babeliales bacterium]